MYLLGEGVEKDPETAKNLMRFIEEEEKKAKKGEASSFPVCSTNTPTKDSCGTAPHATFRCLHCFHLRFDRLCTRTADWDTANRSLAPAPAAESTRSSRPRARRAAERSGASDRSTAARR